MRKGLEFFGGKGLGRIRLWNEKNVVVYQITRSNFGYHRGQGNMLGEIFKRYELSVLVKRFLICCSLLKIPSRRARARAISLYLSQMGHLLFTQTRSSKGSEPSFLIQTLPQEDKQRCFFSSLLLSCFHSSFLFYFIHLLNCGLLG